MDRRYYVFFCGLICLLIVFQWPYFSLYPTSIHAWAQSDLYAISKGFLNNDFDLFHPETYTYNKQFPKWWRMSHETSITAGNIAIHQYVIALLMKVFGSTEPIVYRFYVFCLSVIGIFYLFKIAHLVKLKPIYALFGVCIMVFSPIFLYYQANFLVTIPIISTTICGIYCYLKFLQNDKGRYLIFAILLLTLSALTRTTYIVPLIALFGHQVLICFQSRKVNYIHIGFALTACVVLFIFFYYNKLQYLQHGSIFLRIIRPPKNIQHFLDCISLVFDNWNQYYFSKIAQLSILLVLIVSVIIYRKRRGVDLKNPLYFIIIYFIGTCAFFVAMIEQFVFHDYYFLDSLFIPIVLFCLFALNKIQQITILPKLRVLVILILIGLQARSGYNRLNERYIQWANDDVTKTINAFKDSKPFLAEHGVPKDAKIMVFGCYGPNAPFLMMDRKGYCIDFTKQKEVEKALTWDFDYIVISNFYLNNRVIPEMSFLTEHLIPIATNFEITLFKLGKNKRADSMMDLLNLDETDFKYYSIASSSSNDSNWDFLQKRNTSDSYFTINSDVESGFRWLNKDLKLTGNKTPTKLFFEAKVQLTDGSSFSPIDVFVLQKNEAVLYKSYTFDELVNDSSAWQRIQILEDLPQNLKGKYDFGLQQNNVNHSNFRIDSLIIGIY